MNFRGAMAAFSIAIAACSSGPAEHPATTTGTSTPTGLARALPNCSAPITAIYAVHVTPVNSQPGGDSIFCSSGFSITDINTRLLEWPVEGRQLLAAHARSIVQVDGNNVVAVFDPVWEETRQIGTLASLCIGDPGPLGAVISPDGTRLALGCAHKLLLVDLASGKARTLATLADQWLMPIRWTDAGIVADKVPFEGMGDFGLVNVDPATASVVVINQGPNNQVVISPNGRFLLSTTHIDLGDGPTVRRIPWQNALDLIGPDGHVTRIASEQNHWFAPLDVTDEGRALFSSDSQTDPVTADMGLYLAVGGHPKLQLASSFSRQWQVARFLNASNALVAHIIGGFGDAQTGLGVQVVQMCTDTETGCEVKWSGDAVYNGRWPTQITSMVMLPPAP